MYYHYTVGIVKNNILLKLKIRHIFVCQKMNFMLNVVCSLQDLQINNHCCDNREQKYDNDFNSTRTRLVQAPLSVLNRVYDGRCVWETIATCRFSSRRETWLPPLRNRRNPRRNRLLFSDPKTVGETRYCLERFLQPFASYSRFAAKGTHESFACKYRNLRFFVLLLENVLEFTKLLLNFRLQSSTPTGRVVVLSHRPRNKYCIVQDTAVTLLTANIDHINLRIYRKGGIQPTSAPYMREKWYKRFAFCQISRV